MKCEHYFDVEEQIENIYEKLLLMTQNNKK